VTIAILAANVVLNLLLIPIAAANGAAISLLACECVSTILVYLVFSKYIAYYPRVWPAWRPALAGLSMIIAGIGLTHAPGTYSLQRTALFALTLTAVYVIVLALLRGVPSELRVIIPGRRPQT